MFGLFAKAVLRPFTSAQVVMPQCKKMFQVYKANYAESRVLNLYIWNLNQTVGYCQMFLTGILLNLPRAWH